MEKSKDIRYELLLDLGTLSALLIKYIDLKPVIIDGEHRYCFVLFKLKTYTTTIISTLRHEEEVILMTTVQHSTKSVIIVIIYIIF